MKSSKEHKPKESFALLLIGNPKSGKSSLSMAFPKPYFLDCDNNLGGAAKGTSADFFFDTPILDVGFEEKEQHKYWNQSVKSLSEALASPDVETIIIDSLSILANFCVSDILHLAKNVKETNARMTADKLKLAGEPMMQQSYWGPYQAKIVKLLLACKASGKRLICTVHEQEVFDANGNLISMRPVIQGALRNNLAGYFSDCWRMEVNTRGSKPSEYKIRFHPRSLFQIGNSLQIKEPEMDVTNLSSTQIWNKLEKYFK